MSTFHSVSKPRTSQSNELPTGWQWVQLGNLLREAQAGFACGQRDPDGVIQLRMNNVDTRGNFVWNDFLRVPATPETVASYRLLPGDVLFNNTNSTELVGKSAFFEGHEEPVVYSNHFTRLRPHLDRLLPRFLAAWLNHQWCEGRFAGICNQWIGQSAVKAEKLAKLQFPLPPLDEQQRIAAVLQNQMAAFERARAAAKVRFEAAHSLTRAYLRSVFDGTQANCWPECRLGDVMALRREVIHPRDNPTGQALFVGLEHIQSMTGRRVGCETVLKEALSGRKPQFCKGDIVYGYLRPYLNKVWIAEFDGLCSVDQYVFMVDDKKADRDFVAWFMRSPTYLERAPVDLTPGYLPRIRTEEVAATPINVPPLDAQRKLAGEISAKIEQSLLLVNEIQDEAAAINALPAALLSRAFAGEL